MFGPDAITVVVPITEVERPSVEELLEEKGDYGYGKLVFRCKGDFERATNLASKLKALGYSPRIIHSM